MLQGTLTQQIAVIGGPMLVPNSAMTQNDGNWMHAVRKERDWQALARAGNPISTLSTLTCNSDESQRTGPGYCVIRLF